MTKAVLVSMLKRAVMLVALLCLGCSAQTNNTAEINKRIERQVRNSAELSPGAEIKVGEHKASDFGGWDEVTVAVNDAGQEKSFTFLLSKDGKSLVHYTKYDLSTDPNQKVMGRIDTTGRPTRGSKDAKVVAVVYDDFQCPYCARMYDTLFNDVMKRYGDRVKVIYKDFPLYQIHPWAVRASINANCLLDQSGDAFWQFSDQVHATQHDISQQEATPDPKDKDAKDAKDTKVAAKDGKDAKGAKEEQPKVKVRNVGLDKLATDIATRDKLDLGKLRACQETHSTAAVRASLAEGQQLGVSATPTLFINGEKLEGAASGEELQAVLDRALRDAGVAVPAPPPAAAPATKPASK